MVFTSTLFLFIFFPIIIGCYYTCLFLEKHFSVFKLIRLKDVCLLLSSMLFYSWTCFDNLYKLHLFIIYLFTIAKTLEYFISKDKKSTAKIFLIFAIISLISLLTYFKYFDFILDILSSFARKTLTVNKTIIAPLRISFIIFSSISYVVDVWRGNPAGNLLDVALYISFFPKIISGPIVLWKDFGNQICSRKESTELFVRGINLVIIGFAKKVILADTFGALASQIQGNVPNGT